MKNKFFTFQDHLEESLKNPKFQKEWENSRTEYEIARSIIAKRLEKKISQRDLAKKANTTQAIISRLENMTANPTIALLQKIASALNAKFSISFS